MSPIAFVSGLSALTGIISLVAAAVWVVGARLQWPMVERIGEPEPVPLLLLVASGVFYLWVSRELSRGRKRAGIIVLALLVIGVIQDLGATPLHMGQLVIGAGILLLLVLGWRDLETW